MSSLHKLMQKGGVDMKTKQEFNIIIGNNLKTERERAGLTQDDFSEMIGIGPKSLSAIERGAKGISLTTLRRACDTLFISSDRLMFEETTRNDVEILAERLARMSPKQFEIASEMICSLLKAFALNENQDVNEDTE